MFKYNNILYVICAIMIVIIPFSLLLPTTNYILVFSGIVLFLLLIVNYKRILSELNTNRLCKYLFAIILLIICWMNVCTVINGVNEGCFVRITQICISFIVLLAGCFVKWPKEIFRYITVVTQVCIIVAVFYWGLNGFPLRNYSFLFENGNTFAIVVFFWYVMITYMGNKESRLKYFYRLSCLILVFASSARSVFLSVIIYYIITHFISMEKKSQQGRLKWSFVVLIVIINLFTITYIELARSELGNRLQIISYNYLGKGFFSGRERFWGEVLSLIYQKPIAGYGIGAMPGQYTGVQLSAHNEFLQICFQEGIIGVVLFIVLFYAIFQICIEKQNTFIVGFIAAILVHSAFEVMLTQNFLALGLVVWFLFGVGMNSELENVSEKSRRKKIKVKIIIK